MGRTPISEPCLFCLKLGLIPNLYMIFGITIPNFHITFGIRAFFLCIFASVIHYCPVKVD